MGRRLGCAALAATLGFLAARDAHAEGTRTATDWDRLLEGTMAWVASPFTPIEELDRRAFERRARQRDAERPRPATVAPRAEVARPTESRADARPAHWLDLSPRVSLVARDWGETHKIAGGSSLVLTDVMRLTRSSRVLMSRVHLGSGPLVPFVQVAVGQWRVDTNMVPTLPGATEAATQLGAGFELAPVRGVRLACEGSWTRFYREGRDRDALPITKVVSGLFAARADF